MTKVVCSKNGPVTELPKKSNPSGSGSAQGETLQVAFELSASDSS